MKLTDDEKWYMEYFSGLNAPYWILHLGLPERLKVARDAVELQRIVLDRFGMKYARRLCWLLGRVLSKMERDEEDERRRGT